MIENKVEGKKQVEKGNKNTKDAEHQNADPS